MESWEGLELRGARGVRTQAAEVQTEAQVVEAPAKAEQTATLARSGMRLLMGLVPSLLKAGVLGALKGLFLFGVLGVGVGGAYVYAPSLLGLPAAPGWLTALGLLLPPVALALAGGYALMVRGFTGRLAEEAQQLGLVRYLYAIIKPALAQAARRVSGKGDVSRAELKSAIKQSVAEQVREAMEARAEGPPSFLKKVEGFLAENSRRVLGLVAVKAVLTAPDRGTAVKNLEEVGLERVEVVLSETLEDLFFFQMLLALGAGVLVSAVPAFLMWWLG
jgi:hypothetical protein